MECEMADPQSDIQHWLDRHGGAEATDASGQVIWTHNFVTLSNGCSQTGMATVLFTATDECGNSISTTATITIEDHLVPVIHKFAQDTTVECKGSNSQNDIQHWLDCQGGAQAMDGCGGVIWANNYVALNDSCGPTGMSTVVFTATDECGNSITTSATFNIEDRFAPVIESEAQDTTIKCGLNESHTVIENWLEHRGGAHASDICGTVTWTNDFQVLHDSCGPTGNHIITFTAFDECGNSSAVHATLTILDSVTTSFPSLHHVDIKLFPNPANEIISVDFDTWEPGLVHLILFDACGKPLYADQFTAKEIHIPVSNYPPGVYFLQARTVQGIYVRKVIIN
jgi:hypothetical protein